MSERKEIAKKSIIITALDQIITYFLNFLSRKVFLMTIGVGYLGLNSTLAQILGTLSVSELGIQAVIIYRLYKPMVEKNQPEVCQIVSVIRYLYHYVAGFIFLGSLVVVPFLPCLINDVIISWDIIYIAWLMMALTTTLSYTMNYNSTVLFADQKQYIYQRIHLVLNAAMVSINLFLLYFLQNYLLFLAVGLANTLMSNFVLLYLRRKLYPWIAMVNPSKELIKDVGRSTLDVFAGRIAGYMLNSTSYMVISIFISTTMVGYVSNYTTLFVALSFIISNICGPIQALVGNMLVSRDHHDIEAFVKKFGYSLYAIGSVMILMAALLIDDFVTIFYGGEYVLDWFVVYILVLELYVTQTQIAAGIILDADGQFRIERQFYIKAAILTGGLCVAGAVYLGVSGVLGGLLTGRLYLWWSRSYYCFKYVIKDMGKPFRRYIGYHLSWLILFLILWQSLEKAFHFWGTEVSLLTMVAKGIVILFVAVFVQWLFFGRTAEFQYLSAFLHKSR